MAEEASVAGVFHFFSDKNTNGYKLAQFRAEWDKLTEKDKTDLRTGIGNGTFTY